MTIYMLNASHMHRQSYILQHKMIRLTQSSKHIMNQCDNWIGIYTTLIYDASWPVGEREDWLYVCTLGVE